MTVRLHREISGSPGAPVLVMGSSLGTSAAMFDPLVEMLDGRLRMVRYDHRGHGRSPVPDGPYEIADLGRDVLALLDELGIARAAVGGVSIGGMVAMWLGAHAPDRVERLVLCCTSAHMPPASAWDERAAAVRSSGGTASIADRVVERWLTPGFAAAHPEVRDWLRDMLVASPAAGYAACCGAIERMDLRDDLATIDAPVLVISGFDDPATPPAHQRAIAAAVSSARHETLSPAAHLATVEQPAAAAEMILEHMEAR